MERLVRSACWELHDRHCGGSIVLIVVPFTIILDSHQNDVIPYSDSEELVSQSGLSVWLRFSPPRFAVGGFDRCDFRHSLPSAGDAIACRNEGSACCGSHSSESPCLFQPPRLRRCGSAQPWLHLDSARQRQQKNFHKGTFCLIITYFPHWSRRISFGFSAHPTEC